MRLIIFVLVMLCVEANAAERQLNIPLTLEDQVVLIPQLCDAALFGYRAQFQALCDGLKVQLQAAVAKAALDKTKEESK